MAIHVKNLETSLTHKLSSSELQWTDGGNNNSCGKKGGGSWRTEQQWLTRNRAEGEGGIKRQQLEQRKKKQMNNQ